MLDAGATVNWYGGRDGLRLTRRLIAQAARRLNRGGLVVEVAPEQAEGVAGLVEGAFVGATAWVGEDVAGWGRCVGVEVG